MVFLLSLLLLYPNQVESGIKVNKVRTAIYSASKHHHVPYMVLLSVCHVESKLDPRVINRYDSGSPSYGLCQLKMSTATFMGYKGHYKGLLYPRINAYYAAKYLKYQLDRYKGNWVKAISAYNRGSYSTSNLNYVNLVLRHAFH